MTSLTVPALVVAGLFNPSVSVLPLTQQAMVTVAVMGPLGRVGGAASHPDEWRAIKEPFVSGPIHIAHQHAPCSGSGMGRFDGIWTPPCIPCGGSGWVVRSAQAEQVRQFRPASGGSWQDVPPAFGDTVERFVLLVSGVSSETAPYLGDVTAGWRP